VIGVARDAQTVMFGENDRSLVYLPLDRRLLKDSSMLIRTAGDAQEIQALVRAQARSLEPNMWLWTESLEAGLARSSQMITARTGSFLAAGLGLLALSLASVGLYGVLAYSVSHRTHEIGMRIALGAGRQDILRMVLGQGMHLVAIGIGIGLAGGAAIGRVLSGLLFGLSPLDPITFVSVSIFLTVVALVALYLPARRAASIDPMVALRYE
jgi:putative ABC transport system permease protein